MLNSQKKTYLKCLGTFTNCSFLSETCENGESIIKRDNNFVFRLTTLNSEELGRLEQKLVSGSEGYLPAGASVRELEREIGFFLR